MNMVSRLMLNLYTAKNKLRAEAIKVIQASKR